MSLKSIYLLLCILGAVLPSFQFIPWVMEHGLDTPLFLDELLSTRIGGFFGMDVIVSAVVLSIFICVEGKRLGVNYLWLPILATFSVGVSLGLPLFLLLRQIKLEQSFKLSQKEKI